MDEQTQTPWWRTRWGIVLICFMAIAGFFLITEHTAHFLGALPYLLLVACLLMHQFMHHGHGRHDHDIGGRQRQRDGDSRSTGGTP